MPPSRTATEIIRVVTATLEARANLLDGPGLRALVIDVKLATASGQVRAVIVRPEFEVERPT
jgi:flagellar basal body-associated protein FliL